jgi:hypothetical protein
MRGDVKAGTTVRVDESDGRLEMAVNQPAEYERHQELGPADADPFSFFWLI